MSLDCIQSVLKALNILELFVEKPSWSVSEISKRMQYPTSTTHRLMVTLEEAGIYYRITNQKNTI